MVERIARSLYDNYQVALAYLILFTSILSCHNNHLLAQHEILRNFITSHNTLNKDSIRLFINTNYHPSYLNEINKEEHVDFYYGAAKMFGQLNEHVYRYLEITDTTLTAELVGRNIDVTDSTISPENIVIVEIAIQSEYPDYLSQAISIGAAICVRDSTSNSDSVNGLIIIAD